jgi:hypothetical protein
MKKRSRYITLAILLLVIDLTLTLYYTSRYQHLIDEGNLLISIWQGYLVIPANLIYLLMVWFAATKVDSYQTLMIEARHPYHYFTSLFKSKSSQFILINACYTYIMASFVSRGVAIMDWVVFAVYKENFFQTGYAVLRASFPLGRYDLVATWTAIILLIPLWFILEYQKSKKLSLKKDA